MNARLLCLASGLALLVGVAAYDLAIYLDLQPLRQFDGEPPAGEFKVFIPRKYKLLDTNHYIFIAFVKYARATSRQRLAWPCVELIAMEF